jgi:hypothetical protein
MKDQQPTPVAVVVRLDADTGKVSASPTFELLCGAQGTCSHHKNNV